MTKGIDPIPQQDAQHLPNIVSGFKRLSGMQGEAQFNVVINPHSRRATSIHYTTDKSAPGQPGTQPDSVINIKDASGVNYNIDFRRHPGEQVTASRNGFPVDIDPEKKRQVLENGKDIMGAPFDVAMEKLRVDPKISQSVKVYAMMQLNQELDTLKNNPSASSNPARPTHHRAALAHFGAAPKTDPSLSVGPKPDAVATVAAKPATRPSQFQPT